MVNKVEIIVDSREVLPLSFTSREITTKVEALEVGDYAIRIDGVLDKVRVERKGADVWTSFQGDAYHRERNKILRAKELGLTYILAIESSCSDLRKGHRYFKGGEWVESGRDPLSLIRMLMTISRRYTVPVWFCNGREDMAFRIQEYLMTPARVNLDEKTNTKDSL